VKNLLGGFLSILTQADSEFEGELKLSFKQIAVKFLCYCMKSGHSGVSLG
jgi:hypothetical protein